MTRDDNHLHFEESYHAQDKKASRRERKRLSDKDRSKYKKTDWVQIEHRAQPRPLEPDNLRGRVLGIGSDGAVVGVEGTLYLCQLKGSLKQERQRATNLLAVGDFVHIRPTEDKEGMIHYIEPRKSTLSRQDPIAPIKQQLIAVNIDQVLITTSVVLPALKPYLIDRYIIAATKGKMAPLIVINKTDYFTSPADFSDPQLMKEERALFEELMHTYKNLSIPIFAVSAKTGEGLSDLKKAMEGKTSVFSGQSGTGKSSLINALLGTSLDIGEVIEKTCKGSHTTKAAHLIPLEIGGFCVDTPGIRSFGIWDLTPEEVQGYYTEIFELSSACKFPNCSHLHEPECAVKHAAEEKTISPLRFASYCALMQSLGQQDRRR